MCPLDKSVSICYPQAVNESNEPGWPRPLTRIGQPIPFTADFSESEQTGLALLHNENAVRCFTFELCAVCGLPLQAKFVVFAHMIDGPKGSKRDLIERMGCHVRCAKMTAKWCLHIHNGLLAKGVGAFYVSRSEIKIRDQVAYIAPHKRPRALLRNTPGLPLRTP